MSSAENNEPGTSEALNNKRRRKKSIVWEHFTVETVGAGCTRACCKQCKQTFAYSTGSKLAGTSHLKRHIAFGTCLVNRRKEKNQLIPYSSPACTTGGSGSATDPPKKRYRGSSFSSSFPFDENRSRREIAKMIILHEYPLHMVEHPAFVSFVRNLQPQFNMVNFDTIQGDCMEIYMTEKQELLKLLGGIPGRINLSVDLWMSSQTLGYVFLTGHFISKGWKLHRRILNVVMVPSSHSGDALSHAIGICLGNWGLESKLVSVTLDKSITSNESGSLRGYLSIKNPLILNGQFLIEHCYAHVLSSIAQHALGEMQETISKVRESVKYVKTSQVHEEKFIELKQKLQVPSTKNLSLDDQTQWNTTYLMLVAAIELKEVFSCLDTADPDYNLAPSVDDWNRVESLSTYLKLLYDSANILLGSTSPTANVYFNEVCKIQLELTHAAVSQDPFISNLTKPLKEKFEAYWKDCGLVLAIVAIMDPQFKMKLVELNFSKIYGDDANMYVKVIDEGIHELFSEYAGQPLTPIPDSVEQFFLDKYKDFINIERNEREAPLQVSPGETHLSSDRFLDYDDVFVSEISSSQQTKSELDQYLEESLLPQTHEFDILSWWKLNEPKYPRLSKMARDILSIPVSTVAPKFVFNTGSRVLDRYRSSLRPETLEALICVKDWLHYGSAQTSNALVKMEISIL